MPTLSLLKSREVWICKSQKRRKEGWEPDIIKQETRRKYSLLAQSVKNLPAIQETLVRFLGQEDSSGEGKRNPLQYSCLENSMDRGAWWATVHGVARVRHDWVTNTTVTPLEGKCQMCWSKNAASTCYTFHKWGQKRKKRIHFAV